MKGEAGHKGDRAMAGEAGLNTTKVIVIGGPTASGKSDIALRIAQEFGGAVINADSMQVYQELRIVTARPDDAAISAAPHELYGVLSASERCSAGRWRQLADRAIAGAVADGLLPIVVGGTGLYLKALVEGIAPVPDIPAETVADTEHWLNTAGLDAGRQRLRDVDPDTAARLSVIDRQRLVRALSVFAHTDKPLSWWIRQPGEGFAGKTVRIAVLPPRDGLYDRINRRFAWMIDHGALAEVAALGALDLDPSLPAMKAVGVPAILDHLADRCDRETMIDRGQTATRQYAKRQFTWFRRQYRSPHVQIEQHSESMRDELFTKIRQRLLTA